MSQPFLRRARHVPYAVLIIGLVAAAASLAMITKKPPPPISLDIDGAKKDILNREVSSGWPLTLRLSSNGELGIGTLDSMPRFPRFEEVGYLVFYDGDGCFSFSRLSNCAGTDETYVEFTPDIDLPGRPNPHGNAERLIALTDSGGGGSPKVLTFDRDTHLNDLLLPYGPEVGGPDTLEHHCSSELGFIGAPCQSDSDCDPIETCRLLPINADGYGYGADDDLPGLVVLSDTGVGVVLNEGFNPPRRHQGRNLAGLLNSVAYELRDGSGRPTIVAHINVPGGQTYDFLDSQSIKSTLPNGLFVPAILADRCVGADPAHCTGPNIYRIDGGPQVTMDDNQMIDLLNTKVVTIRAFVVNGTAPSIVTDLNGDGVVDSKDAVRAGYRLLSDEEKLQFVGSSGAELIRLVPLFYDFDGNGEAQGQFVAPGGPGQITKVPQ